MKTTIQNGAWLLALLSIGFLFIAIPSTASADWLLEIKECTDFIKVQSSKVNNGSKARLSSWTIRSKRGSAAKYRPIILEAARTYGVHPNFIQAVIKAESDFNPRAKSPAPANAMGLMQLTPESVAYLGVEDPWDERQNIFGGTKFLKQLLVEFRDPTLVLAGYNWGPNHIRKGKRKYPKETRDHIEKVFREFQRLQQQEKKI